MGRQDTGLNQQCDLEYKLQRSPAVSRCTVAVASNRIQAPCPFLVGAVPPAIRWRMIVWLCSRMVATPLQRPAVTGAWIYPIGAPCRRAVLALPYRQSWTFKVLAGQQLDVDHFDWIKHKVEGSPKYVVIVLSTCKDVLYWWIKYQIAPM